MSTTTSRFNGRKSSITLVAGNPTAIALFAGMTLNQLGHKHQLTDDDITIGTSTTPNGDKIKSLCITLEGTKYAVLFARNYPFERMNEAEWLLDCEFRQTNKQLKDADGEPQFEENGSPKLDETQPYLSFGKPGGIVFEEEIGMFAEPTAAEKAAAKTGAAKTAKR